MIERSTDADHQGKNMSSRAASATALATSLCAFVLLFFHGNARATERAEFDRSSCSVESGTPAAAKNDTDPYAREVTRKGNRVVVSRKLAEAARQNERIVLSRVAVKTRLDANGQLRSYELVQIDKGSVVDKMGLKPGDQITSVNSIPVRDLEQKRQILEKSDRFEVTIRRKGGLTKLNVRIE